MIGVRGVPAVSLLPKRWGDDALGTDKQAKYQLACHCFCLVVEANPNTEVSCETDFTLLSMDFFERGNFVYILVVDDDQFANTLVQFVLTKEGYEVQTTDNPRGAMQMIEKREPDLLILDVSMPYISGFEFSSKLRAEGYETPLIFMTAQDTIEAKLQGFNIGADDYICKPFNHQELVARVHAVMRRIKKNGKVVNQSIRVGRVELFPAELKVVVAGRQPAGLTPTEMHVLRVLMISPGQVVKRDQILAEVWNDNESNSNIVDVYVRRLRSKIEVDAEKPEHIISIRGIGYKFIGK